MKKKRRVIWCLIFTGLVLFFICGISDSLGVTEYEAYSTSLPEAFDGFRILQISDLQNSMQPEILPLARKIKPDIIVLTGDTFYHKMKNETFEWTIDLLKQLSQTAPVYSVSGNHDRWNPDFRNNLLLMQEAGVINLENVSETIEKNGGTISIVGISDPDTMDDREADMTVLEYLQRVQSSSGFDILLFHRANQLGLLKSRGFELVLSGHLHGGQFRLPFTGGLLSPEGKWFPKYDAGLFRIDDTTTAIVSRGIGNTFIVPRLYDPPELVMVTLHKGKEDL